MMTNMKKKPIELYIHIPFCIAKCPYCDFYSVTFQEQTADDYCKQMIRALSNAPGQGRKVDSVYFGGGTPVLLGERLVYILNAVREHFDLTEDCEVTLEANPAAMSFSQLQTLYQGGFNRISMGVQSASDTELARLGRLHSFEQAKQSVMMAQQAGFGNVSVDLMLGTPGQNEQSVDHFIQTFSDSGVQHISGYLLKIEPGTPFARQHIEKVCPDEETSADLYLHTIEQMERHGFLQYEVSNFAKPGFESRHNLKYWNCEEYLGIGPAAHSFLDGKRFYFERDLKGFLQAENVWELTKSDGEGGDLFEYLMLRLRLVKGVKLSELHDRFGEQTQPIAERAAFLQKHGLLLFDGERISLTPKGFLISNSIIVDLLEYC